MANSIFLNGHPIPINLPPQFSLAVVISTIVERPLTKRNARIASVSSCDKNIFNPEDFHQSWSSFKRIDCLYEPIPKTLRKAVVTLSIGDQFREMSRISHPLMQAYAKKIGADFIVIDKVNINMEPLHFEKWQMYDLLFRYDRIIFLDTDILVRPDCPDLFGMVGLEEIGGFVESDYLNRNISITGCQELMGDIGWQQGYLNSGVGVYSYRHKPIFERSEKGHVVNFGEQDMYNYRIKQLGFPVCSLPLGFNRMELTGHEDCLPNRLSSFIIHYAGRGWTGIYEGPEQYLAKVALMKKDFRRINISIWRKALPRVSEILENIYQKSCQGERLSDEEMLLLLAESILFPCQREIIGYQKKSIEGKIDRILVIMLHMIGDVVCATPVIPAIREKYPDAHIAFMVGDVAHEVIKDNPSLDEVILFEERRYWFDLQKGRSFKEIVDELREFALNLGEKRFDLAIDLQFDPRVSYLAYLARPKNMEGMTVKEGGQLMIAGNLWMAYHRFVPRQGVYDLLNRAEVYLKMAGLNPETRQLSIFVDEKIKRRPAQIFESFGIKEKDLVVGFNPSVNPSYPNRAWIKEEYAKLGDFLIKEYGAKIIIFGGPDEASMKLASQITELMKGAYVNLAGKTNLKELAAFVLQCDHFITGDTGPMHIAGACGSKIIAICGPTLFGPYSGNGHLLLRANLPCVGCGAGSKCTTNECMRAITAKDVLLALKYQRGEIELSAFSFQLSNRVTVYTSGDEPPTRLFDYYPLEPKEISCEKLADEILKYAHLNLWIEENNKVDRYEELISKEEMWKRLNKEYRINDYRGLRQEIERKDLSRYLEFLNYLHPKEELLRAKEEALEKIKGFLYMAFA